MKKAIKNILDKLLHKIAAFISRFKKRKGESARDWVYIGEKIGEGLRAGIEDPQPTRFFVSSHGGNKTPYDDKIAEAARELSGEEKPAYLPYLYKIEEEPEAEPEQWPKENPFINLEPLPEIKETDDIINLFGQVAEVKRQATKAEDELAALAYAFQALQPIIESLAETLRPVIKELDALLKQALELYPNKRVVHLAKHAKKERVRKKNIKRIIKWIEREHKRPRI